MFLGLLLVDNGLQHGISRREILLQRGHLCAKLGQAIEPDAREETVDSAILFLGVSVEQDAVLAEHVFPEAEPGAVQ